MFSLLNRGFPSLRVFRNFATKVNYAQPPKPATGIKKLIQQYGYSALGVYLSISIIDIPLCWLLVHSAGEDQIRTFQDSVKDFFGYKKEQKEIEIGDDNSVGEVEKSSTFWTEFAVAYAFHKSLIFIRLPIAAAITPAVVKQLTKWGIKIGKRAPTIAKEAIKKSSP